MRQIAELEERAVLFGDLVKPSKVQTEQAKVLERKWLRLRVHMNERRTTSLGRVSVRPSSWSSTFFLLVAVRLYAFCTQSARGTW